MYKNALKGGIRTAKQAWKLKNGDYTIFYVSAVRHLAGSVGGGTADRRSSGPLPVVPLSKWATRSVLFAAAAYCSFFSSLN